MSTSFLFLFLTEIILISGHILSVSNNGLINNTLHYRVKRQYNELGVQDNVIETFFVQRCLDKRLGVRDTYAFQQLKIAVQDFTTNAENGYQILHSNSKYFCTEYSDKLKKSSKKLGEAMAPCFLKGDENYLESFIPKSIKYIIKFLCDDKGKNIGRLFSESSRACLAAIANDQNNFSKQLQDCVKTKIFPPENHTILTKTELCRDIHTAEYCYKQFLNSHCAGNTVANKLRHGFFEAVSAPCSSCILQSNYFYTISLSFIVLKIFYI